MSVYVFSILGSSPDAAQKYVMERVETTTRSVLTEDAFCKEFEKIKEKHHLSSAILVNAFKLDDEPTEEVEEIMEGDCTQCGHFDTEATYPYMCEVRGTLLDGGCGAWCPKGVIDND